MELSSIEEQRQEPQAYEVATAHEPEISPESTDRMTVINNGLDFNQLFDFTAFMDNTNFMDFDIFDLPEDHSNGTAPSMTLDSAPRNLIGDTAAEGRATYVCFVASGNLTVTR